MKIRRPLRTAAAAVAAASLVALGCASIGGPSSLRSLGAEPTIAQPSQDAAGVLGAVGGNVWSARMEQRRNALESASQGSAIAIERTADNQLRLALPGGDLGTVGPPTSAPTLTPTANVVLDALAASLRDDAAARLAVVAGTSPGGDNAALARTVRDYLLAHGVARATLEPAAPSVRRASNSGSDEASRAAVDGVELLLRESPPA